jgi:hypothetical protein
MNKLDIRASEAQLTELPHTQKKHFLNLLSQLIESQSASFIDISSDITCCRHCLAHKLRSGVNQLTFNVIDAKIPSVVKRLPSKKYCSPKIDYIK